MKRETRKIVAGLAKSVKIVERCYTGGGIYIYRAETKNGKFLLGCTLSETVYVDTNVFLLDVEIYETYEWFEEHVTARLDVKYGDEWDMDDVWHELEKKYKPTWEGYDGYGERIVTK